MALIFAWLCIIAASVILILQAIGLLKAAFTSGPDRRKEILGVLVALPLLLWSFLEFFLVLFKILPESKKRMSRTCHRCTSCINSAMEPTERSQQRTRSLSKVWSRIRAGNDAEIIL